MSNVDERTVQAMTKARGDAKRAYKSIKQLLDLYIEGHALDRAEACCSCLDALICALNVDIGDYYLDVHSSKARYVGDGEWRKA